MTEKHIAWMFLAALVVLAAVTSGRQRWSLDARPILVAIQYVAAR